MREFRPRQLNRAKSLVKQAGFSLLELLIVLAVMAIITTIGLVSLLNYNRAQALKIASQDLKNNLKFAQNKAIIGEKPTGCPTLSAYSLVFTSETEYEIQAVCSDASQRTISQFKLSKAIRKTAGADPSFKIISGGLTGGEITIILTSDFGGTENITITQNGVIQ